MGDTLSSGGRILAYAQSVAFRFRGHMAALIGGEAYCDVCKSSGTIAKTGGPRRMHYMTTRDVALDGDVVLCKCGTPPRIVATLSLESWYEDTAGRHAAATVGGSKLQSARFATTNSSR
ncbi:PAAR domain-containing protein [Paraburkholderia dilworthii]|uniref:PAAR domain-containing protein n=1 Tax=Paraburkholderia dilworthii TaxID=948106 RepID=UPI001FCADEEF|nr:PAAR domain-containing protein [Paraburkholderia dilworthii]